MLANIIALFTKAMLDIEEKTKINALKESWKFVGVLAWLVFFSYNIIKLIIYYELELAQIKIKTFKLKNENATYYCWKDAPRKIPYPREIFCEVFSSLILFLWKFSSRSIIYFHSIYFFIKQKLAYSMLFYCFFSCANVFDFQLC